jgi:hypothetical protein
MTVTNDIKTILLIVVILAIVCGFLLFKVAWLYFANRATYALWKNSNGNLSYQRIVIWALVIISIMVFFNYIQKRRDAKGTIRGPVA